MKAKNGPGIGHYACQDLQVATLHMSAIHLIPGQMWRPVAFKMLLASRPHDRASWWRDFSQASRQKVAGASAKGLLERSSKEAWEQLVQLA